MDIRSLRYFLAVVDEGKRDGEEFRPGGLAEWPEEGSAAAL